MYVQRMKMDINENSGDEIVSDILKNLPQLHSLWRRDCTPVGVDVSLNTCFIWNNSFTDFFTVSNLIWTLRLQMGEFNFLRLLPWGPRRTGRWYASCYLLHTWLQARGEWSRSWGWNRATLRDSSRALAPKSLFDNLFVVDECSSFIFTFRRLRVKIGNEIPVTFPLISLSI